MSNKKRKQNENEYQNWSDTDNGGRLYWKEIDAGDNSGKKAKYEKEVDSKEQTISFVQKIFDKIGNLLEIHEKFPIDKGHIILTILFFIIVGVLTYKIL